MWGVGIMLNIKWQHKADVDDIALHLGCGGYRNIHTQNTDIGLYIHTGPMLNSSFWYCPIIKSQPLGKLAEGHTGLLHAIFVDFCDSILILK